MGTAKYMRETKDRITEFMKAFPAVIYRFEPASGTKVGVLLIAPSGREKRFRVSCGGDPNQPKLIIKDVKRALEALNINTTPAREKEPMRPQPPQRVLHSFHDLQHANAKDLADAIDTTPKEEKPMVNTNPVSPKMVEAQRLRNEGKTLSEISDKTGLSPSHIGRHTTAAPDKNGAAMNGNGANHHAPAHEDEKHKKLQLTHAEMFRMAQVLTEHCKKDEHGFAVYAEGWSDETVAPLVSERCTPQRVKQARIEFFGRTEAETPKAVPLDVDKQVKALLRTVADLQNRVTFLEQALDAKTTPH